MRRRSPSPPPFNFLILRERALPLTTAIEKETWKKILQHFATPRIQLRLLKCLIWEGVSDVSMGLFRGGDIWPQTLPPPFKIIIRIFLLKITLKTYIKCAFLGPVSFVFYENFCSSNFYIFFFNDWKFTHSELSQKKQISSKNTMLISVHKFTEWLTKPGLLKKALYLRNLWINHPNFMHWYFGIYLQGLYIRNSIPTTRRTLRITSRWSLTRNVEIEI